MPRAGAIHTAAAEPGTQNYAAAAISRNTSTKRQRVSRVARLPPIYGPPQPASRSTRPRASYPGPSRQQGTQNYGAGVRFQAATQLPNMVPSLRSARGPRKSVIHQIRQTAHFTQIPSAQSLPPVPFFYLGFWHAVAASVSLLMPLGTPIPPPGQGSQMVHWARYCKTINFERN